jgi:hypothetical protein
MPGVFISYVRENAEDVERLARTLGAYGIKVWLDKNQIKPGYRWREAIRKAISEGDFFIACFSVEYNNRTRTYMNEELILAIDELRQRPTNRAWFIPILLSKSDIPDRDIGGGETLRSIQWEPLYEDWDEGIKRILSVIQPASEGAPQIDVPRLTDEKWLMLLHRIRQSKCTPLIGPGACYGVLPFDGQMAREWAVKYDYQTDDATDLERVAQFLAVEFGAMLPKQLIRQRFSSATPPDFTDPDEPHMVLAALPLTIYCTTNYDDFMMRALRVQKKDPQREFYRWNNRSFSAPSIFDNADFVPTAETPVVFHLHGHTDEPESMVLTEDDYLDFLKNISEDRHLLPVQIRKALASTSLLLFGYSLSSKKFRMLFQTIVHYLEMNPHFSSSDLIVPRRIISSKAHEYIDKYFPARKQGYEPGVLREFSGELRRRWENFSRGT